ncbi:MAG: PTS sugar transporter subunit IIA [Rhodobacteraceae bacterium]|nr:PTS sugar transporter subunit IIA [Paracoccaceae bacterium]
MYLADILKPEAIRVLSTASNKKRLFQEVSELAHAVYGIDVFAACEALMERESLGPTGVGHGVALPHTRLAGLDSVRGAFLILDKPIEFAAVDRRPVDIAFAVFAPEDAGVDYLKALALVSRTLRQPGLCSKLRANLEASKLYAILTETQPVQAACTSPAKA